MTSFPQLPSPRAIKPWSRTALRPLAVDAGGVAQLLSLGKRTVVAYDQAGKIPAPVWVGNRKLWDVGALRRWIAAGAPDRAMWAAMKAAARM